MLRLVTEDWTARLQARLREEASNAMQVHDNDNVLQEPVPADSGLVFGPYGASPISGLHFDTPDDTAAS